MDEHLSAPLHLGPQYILAGGKLTKKPVSVAMRAGRNPESLLRLGLVPFEGLQGQVALEATNRLKVITLAAHSGLRRKSASIELKKHTIIRISLELRKLRSYYAKLLAKRIKKSKSKLISGPGGLRTAGNMVPDRLANRTHASLALTQTRVIYASPFPRPEEKACGNTSTLVSSVSAD